MRHRRAAIRRQILSGYTALTACLVGSLAIAEEPVGQRPKPELLRFNEDWSQFEAREQVGDSLKKIQWREAKFPWVGFGAELRSRLELWDGFAFRTPSDDEDQFLLSHVLAYTDIHLNESFRMFVEGIHANSTGRDLPGGNRPLDVDHADLMNAFVDVTFDVGKAGLLTLRPGRQGLAFGKQRLVSPLPWANTRRSWDGFSAITDTDDWSVHGFWTQFVPTRQYDFNEPDEDNRFFGAYATRKGRFDIYYLGSEKAALSDERHTVGGRVWGRTEDRFLDFDVEGAWQFGDGATGNIAAFMVASQVGLSPAVSLGKARLSLGFDYASGDEEPGVGTVKTFDQLFPLGHAYLGHADLVGRQNIIAVSQGVGLTPSDQWVLRVANHVFWRAQTADALYNAGGGVLRGGMESDQRYVGVEVDMVLTRKWGTHLFGEMGYSHFFAGDFIEDSGAAEDVNFLYLQALFRL